MTLKFSYQGQMHNGAWVWDAPSLVQLIQNQPDLAGFIRGVRVQIKPVPQRKGGEKLSRWDLPNLYRQDCWRYLFHWNNVLLAGASVAANEPTYGFVDTSNSTMTLLPDFRRRDLRANQDDLFCHLFGKPPFPHNGVDNTIKFPSDVAQHPFVYHALNNTRHRLLPRLNKLEHIEPGLWPDLRPDGREGTMIQCHSAA